MVASTCAWSSSTELPLNDLIMQPQPVERLLNILIQTGHGLAAAHAKGIVHRDMKPENIFVTFGPNNEDVPKLLDFGIAKVAGNDGQNNLTRTGTIFGTPFYMAPEQALGNPVDARTDIYAMGVIMYEVFSRLAAVPGRVVHGHPHPAHHDRARAGRAARGEGGTHAAARARRDHHALHAEGSGAALRDDGRARQRARSRSIAASRAPA